MQWDKDDVQSSTDWKILIGHRRVAVPGIAAAIAVLGVGAVALGAVLLTVLKITLTALVGLWVARSALSSSGGRRSRVQSALFLIKPQWFLSPMVVQLSVVLLFCGLVLIPFLTSVFDAGATTVSAVTATAQGVYGVFHAMTSSVGYAYLSAVLALLVGAGIVRVLLIRRRRRKMETVVPRHPSSTKTIDAVRNEDALLEEGTRRPRLEERPAPPQNRSALANAGAEQELLVRIFVRSDEDARRAAAAAVTIAGRVVGSAPETMSCTRVVEPEPGVVVAMTMVLRNHPRGAVHLGEEIRRELWDRLKSTGMDFRLSVK